mgnify:CR=1 FL=1
MKSNLPVIQANLGRYVTAFKGNLKQGLEESGQRGVAIVKQNTPVKSGRLRNSMAYSIDNRVEGGTSTEDTIYVNKDDKNVVVGTNVIYAPSVEYLSNTGSRGFMLRSFKQWKPIADHVIAKALRSTK